MSNRDINDDSENEIKNQADNKSANKSQSNLPPSYLDKYASNGEKVVNEENNKDFDSFEADKLSEDEFDKDLVEEELAKASEVDTKEITEAISKGLEESTKKISGGLGEEEEAVSGLTSRGESLGEGKDKSFWKKCFEGKDYSGVEDIQGDFEGFDDEAINKSRKRGKALFILTGIAAGVITLVIIIAVLMSSTFGHLYNNALKAFESADYKTAIENFKKAEATDKGKDNEELLNYLAQSYLKIGDTDAAISTYNKMLNINPNNKEAIIGLLEIYKSKNNIEQVNSIIDRYSGTEVEAALAGFITATPTISPASGKYEDNQRISITGDGTSAIYYTTDGQTPTVSSSVYTGTIDLPEGTTTLKVIAISPDGVKSKVTEATYEIINSQPDAPVISLASGTYEKGTSLSITAEDGTSIYYTIDGSVPTTSSRKYTGPIKLMSGNINFVAIAVNNNGGKASYTVRREYKIISTSEPKETESTSSDEKTRSSTENKETTKASN